MDRDIDSDIAIITEHSPEEPTSPWKQHNFAEIMEHTTAVLFNATEMFTEAMGNATAMEALPEVPRIPLPVAASRFLTYKVASATHVYLLPIVVVIGLIGNTLSLLIMLKPHNRRISCCNYMAGLAVSDNLMLLNAANYWTVSFNSRPMWNYECKTLAWMFQAVSFTSMILIFSMTVDRFLAVRFPLQARTWCSVHRARVSIAVIATLSVIYTLPYLFTSQLIPAVRTCVAVSTTNALAVVYNWVNIFLGSIVPFVGLLTLNGLIILTVRRRVDLSESSGKGDQPNERKLNGNGNGKEVEVEGTDSPVFQPDSEVMTQKKTEANGTDDLSFQPDPSIDSYEATTQPSENQDQSNAIKPNGKQVEVNGRDNPLFQSDTSPNPLKAPPTLSTPQAKSSISTGPPPTQPPKLNKTHQKSKKANKNKMKQARENQLTIMLLLVTFTFLCLTLPQYSRYLVAEFWNYTASPRDYADFLLLAHASNRFFYMNSAANFFLYCMSGNKFRQDVKSLFVK